MIRCTLILTFILCHSLPALSQKMQLYRAYVNYQKPPTNKLPANCATFQVYVSSKLPEAYRIYPGSLALQVKMSPLKRVLNDSADLRISVTVGDTSSPALIDPYTFSDGERHIVTGSIYLPVYYKLTDNKGMIYEDDSSMASSQLAYTIAYPMNGPPPSMEEYSQAIIDHSWEMALDQNISWMNYRLTEMFFGASHKINVAFFGFEKNEKFGLDGTDKPIINGVYAVLHQFGQDQQWEPVADACNQAIGYWKRTLEKTQTAWQALKDHKSKERLSVIQYDIYHNLAQCAIWARDTDQALYFLDQCFKMKERDTDTQELVTIMQELGVTPKPRRF